MKKKWVPNQNQALLKVIQMPAHHQKGGPFLPMCSESLSCVSSSQSKIFKSFTVTAVLPPTHLVLYRPPGSVSRTKGVWLCLALNS